MKSALHFSLDQDKLHPAFAALDARLKAVQDQGGVKLLSANSLWPQAGYPILSNYIALAKNSYGVTITPLDYKREPEQARGTINQWVEDKTAAKIKDLIPSGALGDLTRLVLVNAIYFKGTWSSPFEERQTADAPFYTANGRKVQARMMHQQHSCTYAELDDRQILELPYEGYDISMVMILPRATNGIGQLEDRLSKEKIQCWWEKLSMNVREVIVSMPKFSFTSTFALTSPLEELGMVNAFDSSKADLSGIIAVDNLPRETRGYFWRTLCTA